METQRVTIEVITKGEKCEMSDQEIVDWYQSRIASLLNPEYGTPQITVKLERNEQV